MNKYETYLSGMVSDKDIISKLSRLKGEEIWNITYAEAMELVARKGRMVVVDLFTTTTTSKSQGIEYLVYVYDITRSVVDSGCENIVSETFESWSKAADAGISMSASDLLKQDSTSVSRKQTEVRHSQGSRMFGRHSEDDPMIFE